MKGIRFIVGWLVLCVAMVAAADEAVRLRVVTYNIHHGEGIDGKLDLERIAKLIDAVDPDIVALQEVDQKATRSGGVDQAQRLADLLEMNVVFGANIDLQGGKYGNALLTRFPVRGWQNVALPRPNEGEQRGVIVAQLEVDAFETPLHVFATHFDHRKDDAERRASVRVINEKVAGLGSEPAILAGDLNMRPSNPVMNVVRQQWKLSNKTELLTIPSDEPNRQLDYVAVRPRLAWKVVDVRVLDAPVESDHRPVLAVLQWQPGSTDEQADEAALPVRTLPRDDLLRYTDDAGETRTVGTPMQWQRRRTAIVANMEAIMGALPGAGEKRKTPAYQVHEEVDCGSYVRQRITYQTDPAYQTPAYLCIPKGLLEDRGTAPAILCLHPTDNRVGHNVVVGLGGRANRQYAQELAERGFVTLSPSYPHLAEYWPDLGEWESGTLKAVWDNVRGIDLLQSLAFVDGDRIGAIGHSLGGHNAVYTAVFDDRIKAVVSSCGLDSYVDYYDGDPSKWLPGKGWTQERYMPRLAAYHGRLAQIPFDFHEMIAALAPRSMLIIAPKHDSNFRWQSVDRIAAAAQPVYDLYGVSSRLQVLHPDCDHDFPDAMREAAYRFLRDGVNAE